MLIDCPFNARRLAHTLQMPEGHVAGHRQMSQVLNRFHDSLAVFHWLNLDQ